MFTPLNAAARPFLPIMHCAERGDHAERPCVPGTRYVAFRAYAVRYHPGMETPLITLASASPRRRRLLAWLGVPFEVASADTCEDLASPLRLVPPVLARSLAADKAGEALGGKASEGVLVACDTIVLLDRNIMGKPADEAEAARMLRALSGRKHQVITGVAVVAPGGSEPVTFAVTTDVTMRELDEEDIASWIAKGEALGCAGAYNIEHHLASVEPGECYQNVAGLPLCHLFQRLSRLGVEGLTSPIAACDAACGRACEFGPRICATPGL
jgi:septum formation protein